MDTLPTELHALICQKACADYGSTIRSLNSVSRYFHEVSRSYLYHRTSAFGTAQALRLLERLERTPPRLREIHHLFLSDVSPDASSSKFPKRLTDRETQALTRIIILAAPTLHSFALVAHSLYCSTALIARVWRTSFPHLQRLALSGFYPFPSAPGRFPKLSHLHLDGNRNPHGLLQMGALEDACPTLSTLRISGLGAAGAFVVELEEALAGDEVFDELSDYTAPTRLPPSIRAVTLQAAPEPPTASMEAYSGSAARMKDTILLGRLEALKQRKAKDGERMRIRVLERNSTMISPEDIRREWLSGVSS
ncbi:hypothetical protein HYPSUDRAFT_49738 [Hypholoma sublateritium FD-334 SS-4]|uniref:F-box domain-containing protein n=1 Tax=Hypholoma sublateritium (strain FD-334 SS-4) TaxID=945553 RepID=A0A0D2NAM3_HYPSF|nr:hypothetical protein HYPSUDRAFT_49738 [Hypholoma sublateritium FD-334 SS-4]